MTQQHAAVARRAREYPERNLPAAPQAAIARRREAAEAHIARCGNCRLELASLGWLLVDDPFDPSTETANT